MKCLVGIVLYSKWCLCDKGVTFAHSIRKTQIQTKIHRHFSVKQYHFIANIVNKLGHRKYRTWNLSAMIKSREVHLAFILRSLFHTVIILFFYFHFFQFFFSCIHFSPSKRTWGVKCRPYDVSTNKTGKYTCF